MGLRNNRFSVDGRALFRDPFGVLSAAHRHNEYTA